MKLLSAMACTVGPTLVISFSSSQAQSPPVLKLTRDLRIDAAQHDLTSITPPGGMTVGPDGTIAFSQNQDGTIRFFDARGLSLGSFGRKGQGPGEFMSITSRFTWVGDTLLASDANTRRLTLTSPDRKLVRTVPWLATASMPPKAGAEAPRLRVSVPLVRYADGSQLVSLDLATGSAVPEWPGGEKPGVPIVRLDSLGGFQRLIAWRPNVECSEVFQSTPTSSSRISIPFCAQSLDEVAPNGSRFVLAYVEPGGAPAFRVIAFGENGDTLFSRRVPYEPIGISSSARDSARATRARGTQEQREAAARMRIPNSHPPVLRLLVGRDGTAWLERSTGRGDHTWLVLDAGGSPYGIVTVPVNTRIMVVARDTAWAIETDDDGLQHIVRFRVDR